MMANLFNNKVFILRNILIPILLVLPIFLFASPLVRLGADNIRMVFHFDGDEGIIIKYAGEIYSKILVPVDPSVGYPLFFYYIAGVVLFPFTWFKGVDYQVITITIRAINILITAASAVLLYFFVWRFFRSIYAATLSALLFATMPQVLWWAVNSRCHPIEIFFIICTLYFCFSIVEKYDLRHLNLAVLFSGLAAAAKYGGLFLIPSIWLSCAYNYCKDESGALLMFSKKYSKIIMVASGIVAFVAITLPFIGVGLFYRLRIYFGKAGVNTLQDFLSSKNIRIIIILSAVLLLFAIIWMGVNYFSIKLMANERLLRSRDKRTVFLVNKLIFNLFVITASVFTIFLLCNPAYLLFPVKTFKATLYQFAVVSMGNALDSGVTKPLFDASGALIWSRMLFNGLVLNNWFALLLLVYIIYELFNLKNNWLFFRAFLIQRIVLLVYVVFLMSTLIVFVSHRPHHYLMPVGAVLSVLLSYAIFAIIKGSKTMPFKTISIGIFAIILSLGFYDRYAIIRQNYEIKLARNGMTDTGVIIGKWIENNFPASVKIWKDSYTFYIPPKYNKIGMKIEGRESNIVQIQHFDPDLLVITSSLSKDRFIDYSRQGLIRKVKLLKHVVAKNCFEEYSDIYIFSRVER